MSVKQTVIITIDLKSKYTSNRIKITGSDKDEVACKFLRNPMLVKYLKSLGYDYSISTSLCYDDLILIEDFNKTHYSPHGFFYDGHNYCQFTIRSIDIIEINTNDNARKPIIKRLISKLGLFR